MVGTHNEGSTMKLQAAHDALTLKHILVRSDERTGVN